MTDTKRKLMLVDEDDEQDNGVEVINRKGEKVILEDEDEEDDEDGLDEFENDRFIVDYDEEEEEGDQDGKDRQKSKKNKKRKLLKDMILDDEDFELLRENRISGLGHTDNVVIVSRLLPQQAFCALDFGLTGVIMKDDYLDGNDDFSLTEKLHEGKNRFLRKHDEACKNELAKKHFKQRTVNHPRFKNITADEAMESLSDMEIGENIFHPSPRGVYYLVLSLKVYDGVYVHKDIIEGQKNHRDIASLLHIGKKLKIGDSIFADLDEVIDQYVNPLVTHVKAIINFKKFKRGSKAEVDELLRAEKSEHPMRIVYCFGISFEHPGTFILSYIRTNLRHEYIGVQPEGFKFRRQIFGKIEQVVAYFQRHIDDSPRGPMLIGNPSSGYSSGASMGSGNDGW